MARRTNGAGSSLIVWMNGDRVAEWRVDHRGGHELAYAPEWASNPAARPLSLSLSLRPDGAPYRGAVVRNFFDNLLPDNEAIRERIQARFGVGSTAAFELLAEVGRDCVGAVQLLAPDAPPPDVRKIEFEALSESEVERVLVETPLSGPFTDDESDFRISLAGAQEKTALLWHRKRWCVPRGATPSTHIFKLPIGVTHQGIDLDTSIENEWLCARILHAFGVPVAECQMASFGEARALVVERFDRRPAKDGTWIVRLPQEDLAQATGTSASSKYESEGGPGIARIMEILRGSSSPESDRLDFLRTQVVFWMLCAIDGHAKNFSLFIDPGGRYRMTPRYDVLSAYPFLGRGRGMLAPQKVKMAMAVWGKNRHYRWAEIRREHFEHTAKDCGVLDAGARIIDPLVEQTPQVIKRVRAELPPRFPAAVSRPILEGLKNAAARLSNERL